jgi:hypothetical protein
MVIRGIDTPAAADTARLLLRGSHISSLPQICFLRKYLQQTFQPLAVGTDIVRVEVAMLVVRRVRRRVRLGIFGYSSDFICAAVSVRICWSTLVAKSSRFFSSIESGV